MGAANSYRILTYTLCQMQHVWPWKPSSSVSSQLLCMALIMTDTACRGVYLPAGVPTMPAAGPRYSKNQNCYPWTFFYNKLEFSAFFLNEKATLRLDIYRQFCSIIKYDLFRSNNLYLCLLGYHLFLFSLDTWVNGSMKNVKLLTAY